MGNAVRFGRQNGCTCTMHYRACAHAYTRALHVQHEQCNTHSARTLLASMAVYRDERFLFTDPFDKRSVNRTTRYRLKRARTERHCQDGGDASLSMETDGNDGNYTDSHHVELPPPPEQSVSPVEDILTPSVTDKDSDDVYYGNDNSHVLMQYPEVDVIEPDSDCELLLNAEQEPVGNVDGVPLYECSSLTVATSRILILKFKSKHRLTNDGLNDLLQLVHLHCPKPNKCITSTYLFNKQSEKSSAVPHHYCSSCFMSITEDTHTCPNELCKQVITNKNISFFTEVPIAQQLKRLLERKLRCAMFGSCYCIFCSLSI